MMDWIGWFLVAILVVPVGIVGVSSIALSLWDDYQRRKKAREILVVRRRRVNANAGKN